MNENSASSNGDIEQSESKRVKLGTNDHDKSNGNDSWMPSSWRSFPVKQQPIYPNQDELNNVLNKLKSLPPLIAKAEIETLKRQLAECSRGERFLIQGGDCAERFEDCSDVFITSKLKILLQMSLVITFISKIPTVRIGRIAGQYAKPRSNPTEKHSKTGEEIQTYRGDLFNGYSEDDRVPDPQRLLLGYFHSATTINFLRCAIVDGLADLRNSANWDMGKSVTDEAKMEYRHISEKITQALSFMETCGCPLDPILTNVDFFTSHEGLHLDFEEAMTRIDTEATNKHFNRGAHMLWIGDRTRQIDHAHVEYFRGIDNPIGIKVGPSIASNPKELIELIEKVDPNRIPGRLVLITRLGAGGCPKFLPHLIQELKKVNRGKGNIVWICDPMHGNTVTSESGVKTRRFDKILQEIRECIQAHKENDSILGGIHLELTGECVTECTGGPENLVDTDLPMRYTTNCDPRLNYAQSLQVAFQLAHEIKRAENKLET